MGLVIFHLALCVPQTSLLPGHAFTCSEFLGVRMAKLLKITACKDEDLMG
jgi:hypothetical protein